MGNVDLTREVFLFCTLSLGQRAHFLETHLKKKIGNSGFHKWPRDQELRSWPFDLTVPILSAMEQATCMAHRVSKLNI